MGYVEKSLIEGEEIIFRQKMHWLVFTGSFLMFVLTVVLFIIDEIAGLAGLLIFALVFLNELIAYLSSDYVITNKRVFIKEGFLKKKIREIQLHKIETMSVEQGILGQIFGYGTLKIIGSGGTPEVLKRLVKPVHFKKIIQEQIEKLARQ